MVIEGGVVYFIRADHIGRPVFATSSIGVKVWTATYHPFGGVHTSTGAPPTARFPGQWFQSGEPDQGALQWSDPPTNGLHQNWMRDYDPTTGRYLQADPLGLIDGASVYGYVRQSPMMYTDPTGECPWCVFGAIVALGMLYDYLSDDCYTWIDFWYSLASNINPLNCRKVPVLCMIRKGGGGGEGPGGGGGGGPGPLPDDTPVCRGGTCTPDLFRKGAETIDPVTDIMDGVSVTAIPRGSPAELGSTVKNNQMGVVTVGDVRAAGGDVVMSPNPANPHHATLSGLTPDQASDVFSPGVQPNPNPKPK